MSDSDTPPTSQFGGLSGLGMSANPYSQLGRLNPYLNVDRSVLDDGPQYIFPEGAKRQRGRFEVAFSQIGGCVMIGGLLGASVGSVYALIESRRQGLAGVARRTQLINYMTKNGAAYANSFGVVAVMYSAFGVLFEKVRDRDDDLNTLASGATTGLLFKCTSGLRKCAVGGAAGLGVAAALVAAKRGTQLRERIGEYLPIGR